MAAAVPVGSSGAVAVPGLQVIAAISACPPARPPEAISAALILRRSIVRREHAQELQKPFHTDSYASGLPLVFMSATATIGVAIFIDLPPFHRLMALLAGSKSRP